MKMKFRQDINAFRAIAVLGVVLFHFNPAWLPGGFAGVDIFFVISGYLMTAIIISQKENRQFSLLAFYLARAKRLLPALVVLCACLLLWGSFFILPNDYQILSKHIFSSLGFFSNIIYWNEISYFDALAREKWLLHTWSLSVEWQFYIIYPIFLSLLYKLFTRKNLNYLFLICTLCGFLFSVLITPQDAKTAYYLLPARAWEMMVGGLAYLYPLQLDKQTKKLTYILSMTGIVSSFIWFSEQTLWPGYLAAVPVFSTFLLIQVHLDNRWLNHSLIQKIGKWSYSVYLWHWPIVVAIFYYSLPTYSIYAGVLLSILLGAISFNLVENFKLREVLAISIPSYICTHTHIYIYIYILVFSVSCLIFFSHYISPRHQNYLNFMAIASQKNPYKCIDREQDNGLCFIGNRQNIQAIIIGDSHAESVTTALADTFDKRHAGVIAMNKSACLLVKDVRFMQPLPLDACTQTNQVRLRFLAQNYPNVPVFLVSRTSYYLFGDNNVPNTPYQPPLMYFSEYFNHASPIVMREFTQKMTDTVCTIRRTHPVFLIEPIPEMQQDIPKAIAKSHLFLNKQVFNTDVGLDFYQSRNAEILQVFAQIAKDCDAGVMKPSDYLCDSSRCISSYNGIPIYYDDDHLNEYGNRLLIPMFKKALNN